MDLHLGETALGASPQILLVRSHLQSEALTMGTSGSKRSLQELKQSNTSFEERQVEIKVVSSSPLFDVALLFENFPVWLVGLEPSRVQSIYIPGFDLQASLLASMISRGHPTGVITRSLNSFGINRVVYKNDHQHQPRPRISLVSGLIGFIHSLSTSAAASPYTHTVGVLDRHFYGRLRSGRPSGLLLSAVNDLVRW
jgi:hypothetical protein